MDYVTRNCILRVLNVHTGIPVPHFAGLVTSSSNRY
jgi:hypothetical protein